MLCVIVILAAALRLAWLDAIEFKADEARHLSNALEIVQHGRFPRVGTVSSQGMPKPPVMTYLMALPVALGRDPRIASGFIALLNVAGVAGFYLAARRYYGWRAAAVAGLLFAANPWAVVLSRKIFTADVLAPFGVLLFYGLCRALVDRRPAGFALAIGALGLMLNVTFSPWPLALVLALVWVIYRRIIPVRYAIYGLIFCLVISLPYLSYELEHRFAGYGGLIQAFRSGLSGSAGAGVLSSLVRPLEMAAWLHSGANLSSLAGTSLDLFRPAHSVLSILDRIGLLLFALSIAAAALTLASSLVRQRQRAHGAAHVLVGLWLLVPLLLFPIQPAQVEVHYLVVLYPAGFLAMGLLVDRVLRWVGGLARRDELWRLGQYAIIGMVLAMVAHHTYTVVYLYHFVARYETSYGLPYGIWREAVALARRELRSAGTDRLWVVARGSDPASDGEPAVLDYLLGGAAQVAFLGQGGIESLLLPVDRAGVYLLTRSAPPVEALLGRLGADERGAIPFADQRGRARVLAVPGRPMEELLAAIPRRGEWVCSCGLTYLGYDWPVGARAGEQASLATYWAFGQIPGQERAVQHSAFNHLLAADGSKVAQRDGFGLAERYWAEGLLLVQWYDLALPRDMVGGDYAMLSGLYRLDTMARYNWVGVGGRDLGDAIELGPVHVAQ